MHRRRRKLDESELVWESRDMPKTFLQGERSSFRVQSRADNDNDSSDSSSAESSESSSNTLTSSSDTLTRTGSPHVGGRPGVYIAVILLTCVTLFALAFQVFPHADSEAREYAPDGYDADYDDYDGYSDDVLQDMPHDFLDLDMMVMPGEHGQYDDDEVMKHTHTPDKYNEDIVPDNYNALIIPDEFIVTLHKNLKLPIDDDKWIEMFSNKLLSICECKLKTKIITGTLAAAFVLIGKEANVRKVEELREVKAIYHNTYIRAF